MLSRDLTFTRDLQSMKETDDPPQDIRSINRLEVSNDIIGFQVGDTMKKEADFEEQRIHFNVHFR